MSKKKIEIELLEKRIELLEQELKELKTMDPAVVNQRFKEIEEALYTSKEILNLDEIKRYLGISRSLLYKLTSTGEIPHIKPRGKMVFFEREEIIAWIKKHKFYGTREVIAPATYEPNDSDNNEENPQKEQH